MPIIKLPEAGVAGTTNSGVKVSAADTTEDYLSGKITVGSGLITSITSPGGDEKFNLELDFSEISTADEKLKITTSDTTAGYLDSKFTVGSGLVKSVVNPGGSETFNIQYTGTAGNNVLYVGKHGNDSNNGRNIDFPFLTFTAALAAISGATATNRYTVVCFDSGLYNEQIAINEYIDVYAPNATLAPASVVGAALTLRFDAAVVFKLITVGNSAVAISRANVVGIPPTVDIGIITIGDNSVGVANLSTDQALIVHCQQIRLGSNSVAVGDISAAQGHTHINIADIYFLGSNSYGIAMVNTGNIVGRVDHIVNHAVGLTGNTAIYCTAGSMDIAVGIIDTNTVYNIAGGTVHLITNSISGTETYTSGYRNILNSGGRVDWENLPTGASGYGIATSGVNYSLGLASARTTASGNKSVVVSADVNAASINADHKILSLDWINNTDTATEVAFIDGTGTGAFSSNKTKVGVVPAGLSNDFGIFTPANTDTLSLWSTKTTASGAVSVAIVSDINAANLDVNHHMLDLKWVDQNDNANTAWYFTERSIEHSGMFTAVLKGGETDNATAVGTELGSENAYTTTGSKLVSVINGTDEKAYVSHKGEIISCRTVNSAMCAELVEEELITVAAAASTNSAFEIPSGALVYGVTCFVRTDIPTASGFKLGYATDDDAWGANISTTAGSHNEGYAQQLGNIAMTSASRILITPTATPALASGQVRVAVFYRRLFAPTQ